MQNSKKQNSLWLRRKEILINWIKPFFMPLCGHWSHNETSITESFFFLDFASIFLWPVLENYKCKERKRVCLSAEDRTNRKHRVTVKSKTATDPQTHSFNSSVALPKIHLRSFSRLTYRDPLTKPYIFSLHIQHLQGGVREWNCHSHASSKCCHLCKNSLGLCLQSSGWLFTC